MVGKREAWMVRGCEAKHKDNDEPGLNTIIQIRANQLCFQL